MDVSGFAAKRNSYSTFCRETLALRVKPEEMHLLLTANDFPVLRRALMLSAHGDQMVRTQARATYLTLLRGLLDEQVSEKAIQLAQEMLLFSDRFMYRNHMLFCEEVGGTGNTDTRFLPLFQTHSDQSVGLPLPTVGPYASVAASVAAATYQHTCIAGSAATKVAAAVDETPVVSVVLHGTGRKISSL